MTPPPPPPHTHTIFLQFQNRSINRILLHAPPVCTNTHFFGCENPFSKACCEDPPFSTELPRRQLCPVTEGEEESGWADSHTTCKPRWKRKSHDPSWTMMLMHYKRKLIYARTKWATRGCAAANHSLNTHRRAWVSGIMRTTLVIHWRIPLCWGEYNRDGRWVKHERCTHIKNNEQR